MRHVFKRSFFGAVLTLGMTGMLAMPVFAHSNEPQEEATEAATEDVSVSPAEPVLEETEPDPKEPTPFTPDGNGQVQDDIEGDDTKEFYTITTKNNNTFYLIIDKSRNTENVYMLSMIDEADLQEFLDKDKKSETGTAKTGLSLEGTKPVKAEEATPSEEKVTEEKTEKKDPKAMLLMVFLAAFFGIGGYFYLKFIRPEKKDAAVPASENMELSGGDSYDPESEEEDDYYDDDLNEPEAENSAEESSENDNPEQDGEPDAADDNV